MERSAVGTYLRTTQAWGLELCEKETLDYGIAYVNPRFALLPEACEFREVVVEADQVEAAFRQTEAWFTERKLRCLRWAPAEIQAAAPLERFLRGHGFQTRHYLVMALTQWKEPGLPCDVRVLPARAMRSQFLSTFRHSVQSEAFAERLDDPQLDMYVAIGSNGPMGRCGLYQVGDLARVVAPAGDPSVEKALISAVLGLAKRLAIKTILIQAPIDDAATTSRYEDYGFTSAGEFVEFDRDPDSQP